MPSPKAQLASLVGATATQRATGQPRGERGLSQERLAELAQMHRTYLGGIETARRNPSFKNLYRLARALGVSLSELFETVQ